MANARPQCRLEIALPISRIVLTLVLAATSLGASAGVIWDEAVNGDLSNTGLAPTFLGTLSLGSNQIFGLTGRPPGSTGVADRDYFYVSVPSWLGIASLRLLPGTTVGNLGFVALVAGSTVTIPVGGNPPPDVASGLLGWKHYAPSDIGTDILPFMSVPLQGSSGFTLPLAAGNYAFWVQDTSITETPFQYGFELTTVPEPDTIALLLLGLAGLGCVRSRRLNRIREA